MWRHTGHAVRAVPSMSCTNWSRSLLSPAATAPAGSAARPPPCQVAPVSIFFPWPSSLFSSPSSSSPHLPSFSQAEPGEDDEREDVRRHPRGTGPPAKRHCRSVRAPPATRAAANQLVRRSLSRRAHAMPPALFADPMRCSTSSALSRRSPTLALSPSPATSRSRRHRTSPLETPPPWPPSASIHASSSRPASEPDPGASCPPLRTRSVPVASLLTHASSDSLRFLLGLRWQRGGC
ncbi:hypothetical protein BRADI_4g04426v3 [Brachypodium distachyon]|uniref:Uncharacterized protein n=1 Tax=Brachypodium distachyon TaxID=15368 RepID=A0A2K2CKG0_BRADI|nr:hypothetical protein BRADI_4g04426v3 [Brachypodium distachyon]